MPDFYRHLSEGELWFPVQYHPELEDGGKVPIQNGSRLPFAILRNKQGRDYVPLFSSEARYDEGWSKVELPPKSYLPAAMPAKQILEILGKAELHAEVNKFCSTGSLLIPPDMMRDLASGTVLTPEPI